MPTVKDLQDGPPAGERYSNAFRSYLTRNFNLIRVALSGGVGISSTFTTVDGKTVTVVDGIITSITP